MQGTLELFPTEPDDGEETEPQEMESLHSSSDSASDSIESPSSISKEEIVDQLVELLHRPQFDVIVVQRLRRQDLGSIGVFTEAYQTLSDFHGIDIVDLAEDEKRLLSTSLVSYFNLADRSDSGRAVSSRLRSALGRSGS